MPPALADERLVTVVLCGDDGAVLGQLPAPFAVAPQWWPEVDPVVAAVRERHGLVVTVLRLLTTAFWQVSGNGRSICTRNSRS